MARIERGESALEMEERELLDDGAAAAADGTGVVNRLAESIKGGKCETVSHAFLQSGLHSVVFQIAAGGVVGEGKLLRDRLPQERW